MSATAAPKACVFCDSGGPLTGEHVFGDWLRGSGLPLEPSRQGTGSLNRSLRELGVTPPFRLKVRDVCGRCNHGWMSALETTAKEALWPLLLGMPGTIAAVHHSGLAAWTLKTALVAMLVSSEEERAGGRGLPRSEYRELFATRSTGSPPSRTQFWIGRYRGSRLVSAWATPVVVQVDGLPEPDPPHGYVMTVIVGPVLIQGVRFTTAAFEVDLRCASRFAPFWPTNSTDVPWPAGDAIDDEAYVAVSLGRNLKVKHEGLELRAWRPATDLFASQTDGEVVQLPTPCGRHYVCYPTTLVEEARRGIFYAFVSSCECGKAYLVETEADGAHFKLEAEGDGITALEARYDSRGGDEFIVRDARGEFYAKRLRQPVR